MDKPSYTLQDLRIYQSLLDGASDDWIRGHLSVDGAQILVSKNRMTRAVAAWFEIDEESVDTFVSDNQFKVLSRLMSAFEELSKIAKYRSTEANGVIDDTGESAES